MAGLRGITILDLTQGVAGPFATRLMSQMGARVIKIERPGSGDIIRSWDEIVNGMCSGHAWVNPGKESVAVDLSAEAGREIVLKLAEKADVIIENFVPGTLEKWGITYDVLAARNAKVIFCRISGFGQDGPLSRRSALDLIIQGESGLILTNGTPEAPAKISVSLCDLSGAMYATIGILEALFQRERTGEGQEIQIALLDAVMTWTGYFPYMYWYGGKLPERVGLHHHTMAPYGPYVTGDGRSVVVAGGAGHASAWKKFCDAIERTELSSDPRFQSNADRLANRGALDAAVTEALSHQGRDHWVRRFHEFGIPVGALNDLKDALDHPRLKERNFILDVDSAVGPIKVFDFPPTMSRAPSVNELGPPLLGEHTALVLAELGYHEAQVRELSEAKIVQCE